MASDEVQPVTAQKPIEGELNVLISMSEKQILSLISATHLPDEENFDADSLLVAVEHEHQKYRENYFELLGSDEEGMENLEGKMSIASFKNEEDEENPKEKGDDEEYMESEEDVENPKEKGQGNLEENVSRLRDSLNPQLLCMRKQLSSKGQENLEEKVSRFGDNFNPQLSCILKQLSSEMACKAPSVEVIMSILNKLSNYSWEAKLLLVLAAFTFIYKDFFDIPNNLPATVRHQNLREISSFDREICYTLDIMKYFLNVKNITKDEPELLSEVEGDIAAGVYWIIVTCTTHVCRLTSDEDKTQDLSPLINKIRSIFSDLGMRISTIEKMYRRKELFANEQVVSLISATHLPDEENFDADSLLVVVEHARTKCLKKHVITLMNVKAFWNYNDLEYIRSFKSEKDVVSRDNLNPQLLCILKQLSSKNTREAPIEKVIVSILNKLSTYSWEAKLLLILAAFAHGLNYEGFLPATLKEGTLVCCYSTIFYPLNTMKCFLKVKKDTKDEPSLLSDVASDIPMGVYWILVTCTILMRCLTGDEDKTQDLSPFVDKICFICDDLHLRISRIEEIIAKRKLKELFPMDAMQPLVDGSTNEQVSIDVLKEKNLLLFISGLNIHKNDKSDSMSIYDEIKKKGDQYKIVWIPIVEQWTYYSRKQFEDSKSMIQRKMMSWYIVQSFSAVAGLKLIEDHRYVNKPIVLLMNPQGDVENKDAPDLIRRLGMSAFPCTLRIPLRKDRARSSYGQGPVVKNDYWKLGGPWPLPAPPPPSVSAVSQVRYVPLAGYVSSICGPYSTEKYTFLCGGEDKQWIEQFSRKVHVVAQDQLVQEFKINIKVCRVGKDRRQLGFGEKIRKLVDSFRKEKRWAVLVTNFSEVISKDGTTIEKVLEEFGNWKVNVREIGFQICFEECHDRLLPTGSQPSASRNV
ncbi:protein SIEVE ELEMENT OCCLUSION B-like isoform X3 [Alnus glutinosa]|uniref:protein SIEVE ELEMENT OCCLUSION B-like isoform X3 n=1 Tax=Alnus glutinosa TaxID=3517 RepID=UPI002D76D91D|nr:protein SIEVE ELEMENT OCCLUSION B-like isoform X3 [Alnus glutinosa]